MISVIEQYILVKEHLTEVIQASGYRNDYIAKKIGMRPSLFSVKKQRGSWSDKELEAVLRIIENEDAEDYILKLLMEHYENDETISWNELKSEMKEWK